jgi:hypothetical protein
MSCWIPSISSRQIDALTPDRVWHAYFRMTAAQAAAEGNLGCGKHSVNPPMRQKTRRRDELQVTGFFAEPRAQRLRFGSGHDRSAIGQQTASPVVPQMGRRRNAASDFPCRRSF